MQLSSLLLSKRDAAGGLDIALGPPKSAHVVVLHSKRDVVGGSASGSGFCATGSMSTPEVSLK